MAVKTPAPQRAAGRRRLAKAKKALPDGSFPIPNVSYLGKAIRAVGRAAPGKRPALARLIRKRAHELGSAGMAKLKGSWADSTQSTKAMANALNAQLIECGYTPEQAALELTRTLPLLRPLEFAGGKKQDPDSDGDDDSSSSGDTDDDYAGKLSGKQLSVYKKLLARKWPAARAYKFACNMKQVAA